MSSRWLSVSMLVLGGLGLGCDTASTPNIASDPIDAANPPTVALTTSPKGAAPGAAAPVASQQVDHPIYLSWADYPVGTEILVKHQQTFKDKSRESEVRFKLIELTPDKVVVSRMEIDRSLPDAKPQVVEDTIRRAFPLLPGVKPEDVGKPRNAIAEGEERLKIGDQEFETVWFDVKGRTEGGHESITRTWMSEKVPGRQVRARITVAALEFEERRDVVEIKRPEGR